MASGAYCARERYPPTRSSSCWARSNRTGPGRSQSSPYPWIVGSLVLAIIALLLVIAAQVMHQASLDQSRPADAIVVFGAAEYVGRPSPVYRARLEHAYALFERGMAPLVITTGGSGKDPNFSEGQVGRDYLANRGIPDVNLIAETQGTDTEHSARRVAAIMQANELKSALLVSDAYHVYRAKRMMEHEGITVYTSPRPDSVPKTRWGRFVAALREAFSYAMYK